MVSCIHWGSGNIFPWMGTGGYCIGIAVYILLISSNNRLRPFMARVAVSGSGCCCLAQLQSKLPSRCHKTLSPPQLLLHCPLSTGVCLVWSLHQLMSLEPYSSVDPTFYTVIGKLLAFNHYSLLRKSVSKKWSTAFYSITPRFTLK